MKILGCIIFLIGLFLSAYLSLYVMLYGGIIDVIHAYQTDPIDASLMTTGIIKALLFQFGWLPGAVVSYFGSYMTSG